MARDNPTWGQARITAELLLKLGIQVSPRHRSEVPAGGSEGWSTPGGSISTLDDLRWQSCQRHTGL